MDACDGILDKCAVGHATASTFTPVLAIDWSGLVHGCLGLYETHSGQWECHCRGCGHPSQGGNRGPFLPIVPQNNLAHSHGIRPFGPGRSTSPHLLPTNTTIIIGLVTSHHTSQIHDPQ
eukprot:scaffold567029_cov63-Attheya_sp.AAC.1